MSSFVIFSHIVSTSATSLAEGTPHQKYPFPDALPTTCPLKGSVIPRPCELQLGDSDVVHYRRTAVT